MTRQYVQEEAGIENWIPISLFLIICNPIEKTYKGLLEKYGQT